MIQMVGNVIGFRRHLKVCVWKITNELTKKNSHCSQMVFEKNGKHNLLYVILYVYIFFFFFFVLTVLTDYELYFVAFDSHKVLNDMPLEYVFMCVLEWYTRSLWFLLVLLLLLLSSSSSLSFNGFCECLLSLTNSNKMYRMTMTLLAHERPVLP